MSEQLLEGVKPTRMELLAIRKRLQLTEKGHKLLSEKRDALVNEFFDVLKERKAKRERVEKLLAEAYESLFKAEMLMGAQSLDSIAQTTPPMGDVELERKNIMGVLVPEIRDLPQFSEKPQYSLYLIS